jgi:hypothetical protein
MDIVVDFRVAAESCGPIVILILIVFLLSAFILLLPY